MRAWGKTALAVLDFPEPVPGDDLVNLRPLGLIAALFLGGQEVHRLGQVRISERLERGEAGFRLLRSRELFQDRQDQGVASCAQDWDQGQLSPRW